MQSEQVRSKFDYSIIFNILESVSFIFNNLPNNLEGLPFLKKTERKGTLISSTD